jgi:hypothetical protein
MRDATPCIPTSTTSPPTSANAPRASAWPASTWTARSPTVACTSTPTATNPRRSTCSTASGMKLLMRHGIAVAFVTARSARRPSVARTELGVESTPACTTSWPAWKRSPNAWASAWTRCAFMGDDLPDLRVMQQVGLSVAPAQAHRGRANACTGARCARRRRRGARTVRLAARRAGPRRTPARRHRARHRRARGDAGVSSKRGLVDAGPGRLPPRSAAGRSGSTARGDRAGGRRRAFGLRAAGLRSGRAQQTGAGVLHAARAAPHAQPRRPHDDAGHADVPHPRRARERPVPTREAGWIVTSKTGWVSAAGDELRLTGACRRRPPAIASSPSRWRPNN